MPEARAPEAAGSQTPGGAVSHAKRPRALGPHARHLLRRLVLICALICPLLAGLWAGAVLVLPGLAPAGPLRPLGSVVWTDPDPAFGGLSGLVVTPDGGQLIALGDRARLFYGDLQRDAEGRLTGVRLTATEPLLNRRGLPLTGFNSDSEDLAADPSGDGTLWVAFEGMTRVSRYPPAADRAGRAELRTDRWNRFRPLFGNQGFEALATLPDGRALAIAEREKGGGTPRLRLWSPEQGWTEGAALPGLGALSVAGAAFGPDGRIWVIERRLWPFGAYTRLRRYTLDAGSEKTGRPPALRDPQLMLAGWLGPRAIWEGIALRQTGQGIVATLISDNGFLPFLETRLSEFLLPDPS